MAPKAKVLVIDDDKTLVAILSASLRAAGYHVLAAYDAMQGFRLAQREVPAVTLLDLHLPAAGAAGRGDSWGCRHTQPPGRFPPVRSRPARRDCAPPASNRRGPRPRCNRRCAPPGRDSYPLRRP